MLVANVLLAATIKYKGRIKVQFQGKGNLKLLMTECNHNFEIRGLAQYKDELNDKNILAELQSGFMGIIIDPEDMAANSYQGIVSWEGNSIVESIEAYFQKSEQIPTRLWIAYGKNQLTGLLIQALPSSAEKEITQQQWQHIENLTATLTTQELLNDETEVLLHKLYSQEEVRLFHPEAVSFRCNCSVSKSEQALLLLGRKEVDEELKLKKEIVVTCDFCNKSYFFDAEAINKIFPSTDGSSNNQLH
jgi:molecular chaperone Hsp33